MKKRVFTLLFAVLICFSFMVPCFAAEQPYATVTETTEIPTTTAPANVTPDYESKRFKDFAGLLDSNSGIALSQKLDEISERQKFDIVIVTTNTLDDKTPEAYADDYYDYNGYGFGNNKDGVLLLVCMTTRDFHISTTGYGITAITDAGREYIQDEFVPSLSNAEYVNAFNIFAQKCDEFVTQAKTGEPYDVGNLPKDPYNIKTNAVIAAIIGLIVALIVTSKLKGKLKTIRFNNSASEYVRDGSMNVTEARDTFLYTHVDRTARPKETSSSSGGGSSTHTSSSGTTHGGGGGKF